jgi:hypothetical protein
MDASLIWYDCPECGKQCFLVFDGKATYCPVCLSVLIPREYPKMSTQSENAKAKAKAS